MWMEGWKGEVMKEGKVGGSEGGSEGRKEVWKERRLT